MAKSPPAITTPTQVAEFRRRRRNAKTYRSLKKRRLRRKTQLVSAHGGRCVECGYAACLAALEFHHRDSATKEFGVGNFSGSLERLVSEAEKCDLLCANCHRIRHAATDKTDIDDAVVEHRRRRKAQAVAYMGSDCLGCGRNGPASLFEFHHTNADEKDFELAKCVMLCANCHREVHAGVRDLDEGLLAEEAAPYLIAVA